MTLPMLFVHGIARFDAVTNAVLHVDNTDDPKLDSRHYFKGIRTMLMKEGYTVRHANLPFADSVEVRAAELLKQTRTFLDDARAAKIHIVAHSMGGLDARHMLFNDRVGGRIHQRVASVTTISSPHAGSPVADLATQEMPHLEEVLKGIGLNVGGLRDCTTGACKAYNDDPAVIDFEANMQVPVFTYAGRVTFFDVLGILKPFFFHIYSHEGAHDGLVSVQSGQWRNHPHQEVWEHTDHLNELGWSDPGQLFARETSDELLQRIHASYRKIAARLTDLEQNTPGEAGAANASH